jgi:hypothetical protein
MLICYHNQSRLVQNDLVYLAFLFSLYETIAEIDVSFDLDESDDDPGGFLTEVPFLQPVPLPVQVDLLAETWCRHRCSERVQATLLDAAIVFSACTTAARIVNDERELATAWLLHSPRQLDSQVLRRAPERLDDLFDRWWDDRDFHLLDDLQDMPPADARRVKNWLGLPNKMIQPMFDALERGRVSPDIGQRLVGLLAPEEISDTVSLLRRPAIRTHPTNDDEG